MIHYSAFICEYAFIKAMEYQNKNQIGKILAASLGLLDGIALSYTAN